MCVRRVSFVLIQRTPSLLHPLFGSLVPTRYFKKFLEFQSITTIIVVTFFFFCIILSREIIGDYKNGKTSNERSNHRYIFYNFYLFSICLRRYPQHIALVYYGHVRFISKFRNNTYIYIHAVDI